MAGSGFIAAWDLETGLELGLEDSTEDEMMYSGTISNSKYRPSSTQYSTTCLDWSVGVFSCRVFMWHREV